jgi:hypothetical protein
VCEREIERVEIETKKSVMVIRSLLFSAVSSFLTTAVSKLHNEKERDRTVIVSVCV